MFDLSKWREDPERRAHEARYKEASRIPGVSSLDDVSYAIRARAQGKSPEQITAYLSRKHARTRG